MNNESQTYDNLDEKITTLIENTLKHQGKKKKWLCDNLNISAPTLVYKLSQHTLSASELIKISLLLDISLDNFKKDFINSININTLDKGEFKMAIKPNWYVSCSPRSPEKIIPEITELYKYDNMPWAGNNSEAQSNFAKDLANMQSFKGETFEGEASFSARDRVAPMKTYGFAYTGKDKKLHITPAGKMLVDKRRPKDVFLKQLVKWQYPSSQHKGSQYPETNWNIRPFVFFLKVLYKLQCNNNAGLTKLELAMFILIATKDSELDDVVNKILNYRAELLNYTTSNSRKEFTDKLFFELYSDAFGNINTVREGKSANTNQSAIRTKMRNALDVADATFRYFSFTGLFSSKGNKLILNDNRKDEIIEIITSNYFNKNYNNIEKFHEEFGNPSYPFFSIDNITSLRNKILECNNKNLEIIKTISIDFPNVSDEETNLNNLMIKSSTSDIEILKDILYAQREINLDLQKKLLQVEFKNPEKIQELIDLFNLYYSKATVLKEAMDERFIANKNTVLEYLTLNGFIALGGALNYINNYTIDESLQPISHAAGNQSDVEIDYDNFFILGEVTTSKGKTQYQMEGEPVTRHFANKLSEINQQGKELYCVFIAPTLNSNTIHEFAYVNSKKNYNIVPITIKQFINILSVKKNFTETNKHFNILEFKELLNNLVKITRDTKVLDSDADTKIILSNLDKSIENWCNNLLRRD
ncbi:AlwI family type II restriction endonuclease [Clostridium sp.]|uniref:AlwI family type II restriction endonuclease n=1 Tax=Clostridium sp. TaxID=1506 RepID=UPI002906162C|nr:AlwI family type II restriction endonuclease [Clostridium sp.]MDU4737969.1 AlwI family type II restriction endonuclease [Clostridium sp.]